jgi:hypothetical protein
MVNIVWIAEEIIYCVLYLPELTAVVSVSREPILLGMTPDKSYRYGTSFLRSSLCAPKMRALRLKISRIRIEKRGPLVTCDQCNWCYDHGVIIGFHTIIRTRTLEFTLEYDFSICKKQRNFDLLKPKLR